MSDTLRLIARAQDGDARAFDLLVERHRGRLAAFVAARMHPALRGYVEPDDVVQEACLEAAGKLDAFVARSPSGFYHWLVRIADYKLKEVDRRRRAKKRGRPASLQVEPASIQTSVAGRVGRAEHALRVARALETLPDAQAEAVRLRYLQGLSVAETASRLDRSEAAVKALVARGLAALAARLRAEAPSRP